MPAGSTDRARPRVLIGGVGYRWQRDASLGLVAADELATAERPAHVDVADLGYGAIYAAQDIAAADPPYDRVVLLAAVARGREPGTVHRYAWDARLPAAEDVLERIREAGAGVVTLEHLLVVGTQLRALPADVRIVEVEPPDVSPGAEPTSLGAAALPRMVELARAEAD